MTLLVEEAAIVLLAQRGEPDAHLPAHRLEPRLDVSAKLDDFGAEPGEVFVHVAAQATQARLDASIGTVEAFGVCSSRRGARSSR
jgi:hypothetical protein